MSQPFVGEIRMFGGNFAPAGWMFCAGQLLSIAENESLFNLIGTTFGGDGQNTFALPDLRGRIPLHQGNGFTLAQTGGVETVTLTLQQIPSHTHVPQSQSGNGSQVGPGNGLWATETDPSLKPFSTNAPAAGNTMNPACIGSAGGSQPHENRMPYLAVSFIISLFGIFPSAT